MTDHTGRMPGFVLDHLHRSGWTSFREVQERAFDVLFDTTTSSPAWTGCSGSPAYP